MRTNIDYRSPHYIQVGHYKKFLWQVNDAEEFKRVFIGCVNAHYDAYTTYDILLPDIGENDLMIYCPGNPDETTKTPDSNDDTKLSRGILIDFDLSPVPHPDGRFQFPTKRDGIHHYNHLPEHHPTETRSFMALSRLDVCLTKPKYLVYRYSLESFFYILLWATMHYDLGRSTTRHYIPSIMRRWSDEDLYTCYRAKATFFELHNGAGLGPYRERRLKCWEGVWREWVKPLHSMFSKGHYAAYHAGYTGSWATFDFTTCDGHITFKRFMGAIGVKVA